MSTKTTYELWSSTTVSNRSWNLLGVEGDDRPVGVVDRMISPVMIKRGLELESESEIKRGEIVYI
jgi:hypothetical protein